MEEDCDPLAKFLSDPLIVSLEVIGSIFWSAEGGLKRVNVVYLQFAPHGDTGSSFLIFSDPERAALKLEGL
jgi:hypothetical protein